ncbi:DUF397 domain-containing protein [Streptomyces ureilyticus]|uniref:DUF397 domain-containing protein n=1 Tax=Streptomyces ureilyticus TaxID=1775131 RepID=A0ABX0E659_9ACTN|nr:DUF397 domain-containing protein [Streptomyces ureilyticus]NGO46622.1 DUF397 domain-containing protein [Streptomyces ureilyticus]
MENNAMPTVIQWRKSSYSSDQGGNCVKCAPLGSLTWRKSTYSGDQGGNCLEIAETPNTTLAVRDSKNPTGPHLTFAPAAFTIFVHWTRNATTAAE